MRVALGALKFPHWARTAKIPEESDRRAGTGKLASGAEYGVQGRGLAKEAGLSRRRDSGYPPVHQLPG